MRLPRWCTCYRCLLWGKQRGVNGDNVLAVMVAEEVNDEVLDVGGNDDELTGGVNNEVLIEGIYVNDVFAVAVNKVVLAVRVNNKGQYGDTVCQSCLSKQTLNIGRSLADPFSFQFPKAVITLCMILGPQVVSLQIVKNCKTAS